MLSICSACVFVFALLQILNNIFLTFLFFRSTKMAPSNLFHAIFGPWVKLLDRWFYAIFDDQFYYGRVQIATERSAYRSQGCQYTYILHALIDLVKVEKMHLRRDLGPPPNTLCIPDMIGNIVKLRNELTMICVGLIFHNWIHYWFWLRPFLMVGNSV